MSERYVYVIEAYGYSDFETNLLIHKTKMSNRMFLDIVKKAQQKVKEKHYGCYDYASNMITCLCREYGFEPFEPPTVHIGCSTSSKCS